MSKMALSGLVPCHQQEHECSSSEVVLCFSQIDWKKFQTLNPYTLICLALIYTGIVDLLLVRAWCLEGLIFYRKQTFGGVTYCVELCTFIKTRPGIFLPVLFRENQDCLHAYTFKALPKAWFKIFFSFLAVSAAHSFLLTLCFVC